MPPSTAQIVHELKVKYHLENVEVTFFLSSWILQMSSVIYRPGREEGTLRKASVFLPCSLSWEGWSPSLVWGHGPWNFQCNPYLPGGNIIYCRFPWLNTSKFPVTNRQSQPLSHFWNNPRNFYPLKQSPLLYCRKRNRFLASCQITCNSTKKE